MGTVDLSLRGFVVYSLYTSNIGEEIAEIATSIFVLFRTRLNALFTWRRFFFTSDIRGVKSLTSF